MTIASTVLAVLAAVLVAVFVLRQRNGEPTVPASDLLPAPARQSSEDPAEGPGPDDIVLVPFPNATGLALLVGPEDALAVFDQSGLTRRDTGSGSGPVPQLVRNAMAAGGLRATDTFQRGANSGRLVELAPETMKHLAKGKPVYDKSGNVLALVRGDKGQLRHVMRFKSGGAQAAAASNMATLAVTAALSQQLDAISQQLQEMSKTLEGMVRDKDRERLSDALGANEILLEIAENVRRRGITQADYMQLASLKHKVTSLQIETTAKLAEIAPDRIDALTRHDRHEILEGLYEKERLEYWLVVQVQADLARTRTDLLTLLWEHQAHPETAAALNSKVAEAIRTRQRRTAEVGEVLRVLADPSSQTRLDPVRVISRHRLRKAQVQVEELLLTHGEAFAGPERDPHTVPEEKLAENTSLADVRELTPAARPA